MDTHRQHNKQHGGSEGEFQSTHPPFGRGGATWQDMIQSNFNFKVESGFEVLFAKEFFWTSHS